MYIFMAIFVVKQVSKFHDCKNRACSQNDEFVFKKHILMFMLAEKWASARVKIAKLDAFVQQILLVHTENEMKLNFVALTAVFLI